MIDIWYVFPGPRSWRRYSSVASPLGQEGQSEEPSRFFPLFLPAPNPPPPKRYWEDGKVVNDLIIVTSGDCMLKWGRRHWNYILDIAFDVLLSQYCILTVSPSKNTSNQFLSLLKRSQLGDFLIFSHVVCCHLEFKLCYIKKHEIVYNRVNELFEPIVLRK